MRLKNQLSLSNATKRHLSNAFDRHKQTLAIIPLLLEGLSGLCFLQLLTRETGLQAKMSTNITHSLTYN